MSWLLFGTFVVLMCAAVPLAVALGLSGVAVIVAAKISRAEKRAPRNQGFGAMLDSTICQERLL